MHRLSDRPFFRLALIGAFIGALALAGCGRKGPLDPPPAALTDQHPAGSAGTAATAAKGQSQADQKPNKRFLLDPLLN